MHQLQTTRIKLCLGHSTMNILSHRSFNRVRKTNKPAWNWMCAKLLGLKCAIEDRNKIGGDLSRLLFRYGVGRILFTSLGFLFTS